MTYENNAASSEIENNAAEAPVAKPVVVLTKEERIAKVKADIAKLELKLFNIENDITVAPRAAKVVPLPEVGSEVSFLYGRRTATTEPTIKTGVVFAIKAESAGKDGKKLPAQVKVLVGEGAEAEFTTIYPGQILDGTEEQDDSAE